MEQAQTKSARIDIRLPVDQKAMIEYAAHLEGYKNVTEFMLVTLSKKAERIIRRRESIVSTKRDQELFFNSLLTPPLPNESLKQAAERYAELMHNK